jgi:hypothetical protein
MAKAADQRGEDEGEKRGDHQWLDNFSANDEEKDNKARDNEPVGQRT